MKTFLIIVFLVTSSVTSIAQKDISNSLADRETLKFNKLEYTVQQYLIDEIRNNTDCCGEDELTIKVEIDPSGKLNGVKPTSGSSFCYQKAILKYTKNIKWTSSDSDYPELIEFEIKLDIKCKDDSSKSHETGQ